MFDSEPPIFFATVYGIMLLYYIRRAILNPTEVFIFLSIFCTIRITTFVIFALLLHLEVFSPGAGIMLNIFLCIGLCALLYSAYVLVLDREIASGKNVENSISQVTSGRCLTWAGLGLAFDIFVMGNTFDSILQGVYSIFSYITILMGCQTLLQAIAERTALSNPPFSPLAIVTHYLGIQPATPSRKMYNMYITCLINEKITISMANLPIRSTEWWWSLWALTELVAVSLFAAPDLVPEKKVAPRTTYSLHFTRRAIVFAMTLT